LHASISTTEFAKVLVVIATTAPRTRAAQRARRRRRSRDHHASRRDRATTAHRIGDRTVAVPSRLAVRRSAQI
jgi:hypothetical protein